MSKEGTRVKGLDPLLNLIPYIMVERSDSQNTINDTVDITEAEVLLRKLRAEGYPSIGMMHLFLAAYVRTVSQRPRINRFIRGQKIYARNTIAVSLSILRKMSLDGQETTVKMYFSPEDTLIDVYRKANEVIEKSLTEENNTDGVARVIDYIPGLLKKFTVWFLKTLDYFGLLPKVITEASPFHASMFITNMASLNIPPIRHHLYNFGNVPIFVAFGAKRTQYELLQDGSVKKSRVVDYVINMDERTCDGYYYASALKILRYCLKHPEQLLTPPVEVSKDK